MSEHPREHEQLLAALLGGERRPEEPEVALRLRECARCGEEWARLRDSAAELERLGAGRRAELAELERMGPVAGEERVRATLEQLADRAARGRRRRALVWVAAAALLVVGAWVAQRFAREADRPDPTYLGESPVKLLSPRDGLSTPPFEGFTWTYTGDDDVTFTLRIYERIDGGLANGPRGELLLERQKLEETTWTPDAHELETLPARIVWEVEAFSVFRISLGSDWASASLR